jgi:uncharacterized membrane protein (DUF106 family)
MTWDEFVAWVRVPPGSMALILFVSVCVALSSTLLNKLLLDQERLDRMQAEITEHGNRKKVLKELSESNPKKYAKEYRKWKKKEPVIEKMKQKMSLQRMKPSLVTMLPLIAFFYVLRGFYTNNGVMAPVAKPPMNPWDIYYIGAMMHAAFSSTVRDITIEEGFINYTGFYVLCSFTISTLVQKLFGVSRPQGGMSSIMDQNVQLPEPTM